MLRALEFSAFVVLAGFLHVLLWPRDMPLEASAAGAGGQDLVSLVASSAAIERMVAEFERPPAVTEPLQPAALQRPPDAPTDAPPLTALPPPPPAGQVALPLRPLPQHRAPSVTSQAPEPPPPPDSAQAVETSQRPPERPERRRPEPAAEPATAERPASEASPAPQAAGAGNTGAAGRAGTARSATLSNAARQSLLAEWGGAIRAQVQRRSPRDNSASSVTVRLNLSRSGALMGVRVVASSGNARFNDRLLKTIRGIGRLPAAPRQFPGESNTFDLTIRSN